MAGTSIPRRNRASSIDDSPARPPFWRRLNWVRIVLLMVGLYYVGGYLLSGLGLTETDRVLQTIYAIEEAVEDRSTLKFQSTLSSDYQDRSGLNKRNLVALATRYFRSDDRVEIIHLSSDVEFPTEETAEVDVRVQVIGRTGGSWARGLSDDSPLGEKYTFHLKKESGDWKITSVDPARGRWPRI